MSEIGLFFENLNYSWDWIESSAVLMSVLYVFFAAKENIWCWFFGAISAILYTYICFNIKLYAETFLQLFYLIMAVIGYISWKKTEVSKINQWSVKKHLILILLSIIFVFIVGFLLSIRTDAKMPLVDTFTTVFSVVATILVIKKVLENWLYWIVIDLVSIFLYFERDLHLSSILFMIYTIIAIKGYFSWIEKSKLNV